jgi:hypothetical protein
MNSVAHFAETVQRIFEEEAEQLAREVSFIKRARVLSGADFVQSLILGWLQEPEITLNGLTQVLQRASRPPDSANALRRRRRRCCSGCWNG